MRREMNRLLGRPSRPLNPQPRPSRLYLSVKAPNSHNAAVAALPFHGFRAAGLHVQTAGRDSKSLGDTREALQ